MKVAGVRCQLRDIGWADPSDKAYMRRRLFPLCTDRGLARFQNSAGFRQPRSAFSLENGWQADLCGPKGGFWPGRPFVPKRGVVTQVIRAFPFSCLLKAL